MPHAWIRYDTTTGEIYEPSFQVVTISQPDESIFEADLPALPNPRMRRIDQNGLRTATPSEITSWDDNRPAAKRSRVRAALRASIRDALNDPLVEPSIKQFLTAFAGQLDFDRG